MKENATRVFETNRDYYFRYGNYPGRSVSTVITFSAKWDLASIGARNTTARCWETFPVRMKAILQTVDYANYTFKILAKMINENML